MRNCARILPVRLRLSIRFRTRNLRCQALKVCFGSVILLYGFVQIRKAHFAVNLAFADRTGLEPATSAVTGRHSNQLNYRSNLRIPQLPMGLKSGPTRLAGLLGRGRCEIFGMAKIGEFRFSPTNCNKTFYRKGKTLNFTPSYSGWATGRRPQSSAV